MSLRATLRRSLSLLVVLAACGESGPTSPLLQPPAMVVAAAIPFGSSFLSAQVTNISPNYMGYGLCGSVYAEQRTGGGWERVSIIPVPVACTAVAYTLSGFGSTAIITVPLAASAPAGEYRLRMPFNHKSETFVSTSNAFTIE
jgi:predicted small lipoprotein YifL